MQQLDNREGHTALWRGLRWLLAAVVVVGVGLASDAVTPRAAGAAQTRPLQPVRVGGRPTLPRGARPLGALAGTQVLHLEVTMQPRDAAGLARFATEVSTPGSAMYRRYLPAGRFAVMFGPLRSTVDAVENDLRGEGLSVGALAGDRLGLAVNGTAAEVGRAFAVSFERYQIGARVAYANTAAPRFAGAISKDVQGVIGLDDLYPAQELSIPSPSTGAVPRPAAAERTAPHVVTGGPQPCSQASAAAPSQYAYTADEIASAYRFSSLYTAGDEGAGVTVALYELAPDTASDIAAYQACYGTDTSISYTEVDGGAGPTGSGEGIEPTLDTEEIIGLAPKANVDVYEGPDSGSGVYDTYNAIVSDDTAQVISTSWGLCELYAGASVLAENTLFEQAATQGQSVFAAAGDSGSEACQAPSSALAVDDPASQPFVTGVGGTTLSKIGPPPVESVWNDASKSTGAGGGGISDDWPMPPYQSGAPASLNVANRYSSGAPCNATSGYCREVPDVSADADPYTGYLIYYSGTGDRGRTGWVGIGGTSMAAPIWASLAALTDADTLCKATSLGFANPALYSDAGSSGYASSFQDVVSGNNDYTGTNGGLYPAARGYDMASGLGTPDAAGLAGALCKDPTPAAPAVTTGTTSALNATSATLSGTVDPHGYPTTYQFEYGTTTAYGSSAPFSPASAGTGTATVARSVSLKGLTSGTTYDFRLVAKNVDGTSLGANRHFSTPPTAAIVSVPNPEGPAYGSLVSTSCPTASDCVAVGYYYDSAGNQVPLIESESSGTWSLESTASLPEGASSPTFTGVSCSSASSCVLVGYYTNTAGYQVALIETDSSGNWTFEAGASLPSGGFYSSLSSVSCVPSSSTCVAVGTYIDPSTGYVALIESYTSGSWSIESGASLPAGASTPTLNSVSCASTSSCISVGYYNDSLGAQTLLIESDSAGTWSLGNAAPPAESSPNLTSVSCSSTSSCLAVGTVIESYSSGTWSLDNGANLPEGAQNANFGAVSCAAGGSSCVSVGSYFTAAGNVVPLIELESNGSFSFEAGANLPAGAVQFVLAGVSCATTAVCLSVGTYLGPSFNQVPLIESYASGTWTLQSGSSLPTGSSDAQLWSTSCPAASSCIAVGQYVDAGGDQDPLIESDTSGRWSLQPSAVLPAGAYQSALSSVSCERALRCVAAGYYTDAAGNEVALLETGDSGHWHFSSGAALPSGSTSSELTSVSCAVTCVAVGTYETTSGQVALLESDSSGSWRLEASPALPAGGTEASVTSVSCTSSVSCVAVGSYFGAAGQVPLIWIDTAGTWRFTAGAAMPPGSSVSNLTAVSCPKTARCVAVGSRVDAEGWTVPVIEAETSAGWHLMTGASLPAATLAPLNGVTCLSPSSCMAVGFYLALSGHQIPIIESYAFGKWHLVSGANLPPQAYGAALASISCVSSASCISVGQSHPTTSAALPFVEKVMIPTPVVRSEPAISVTSDSARLRGTVDANGYATTYQFQYGTGDSYRSVAPARPAPGGSGMSAVARSVVVRRLRAGTTYHFRLVATNANGTTVGPVRTFTTKRKKS